MSLIRCLPHARVKGLIFRIHVAADTLPTPRTTPSKKRARLDLIDASSPVSIPSQRFTNIFDHASSLLSTSAIYDTSSVALPLIGREKETALITTFLARRFPGVYEEAYEDDASVQPSLYISGPPGIGKTASTLSVLRRFVEQSRECGTIRVHMENCSSIGSAGMEASMWSRLGEGLGLWSERTKGQSKGRGDFVDGMTASGCTL